MRKYDDIMAYYLLLGIRPPEVKSVLHFTRCHRSTMLIVALGRCIRRSDDEQQRRCRHAEYSVIVGPEDRLVEYATIDQQRQREPSLARETAPTDDSSGLAHNARAHVHQRHDDDDQQQRHEQSAARIGEYRRVDIEQRSARVIEDECQRWAAGVIGDHQLHI